MTNAEIDRAIGRLELRCSQEEVAIAFGRS